MGILNKLTPQKFKKLANQALEMPINSEERLQGCVDIMINVVCSLCCIAYKFDSCICTCMCVRVVFACCICACRGGRYW